MGALDGIRSKITEAGESVADALKHGADKLHDQAKVARADAHADEAESRAQDAQADAAHAESAATQAAAEQHGENWEV